MFVCQEVTSRHGPKSDYRSQIPVRTVLAMDGLLTRADIARRLGITTERVRQLGLTRGFPAPVGKRGAAFVWRETDVARWADVRRRPWPPQ
jgi:hypothetical protein